MHRCAENLRRVLMATKFIGPRLHRLGKRLRVAVVVLVAHRDWANVVPECLDLARKVMRAGSGLEGVKRYRWWLDRELWSASFPHVVRSRFPTVACCIFPDVSGISGTVVEYARAPDITVQAQVTHSDRANRSLHAGQEPSLRCAMSKVHAPRLSARGNYAVNQATHV